MVKKTKETSVTERLPEFEKPTYKVTVPVDLVKLGKEIALAHGWDTQSVIASAHGDLDNVSEESPILVWFNTDELQDHLVGQTIKDHQIIKPTSQSIWSIIEQKADEKKLFTPEEIQIILGRLVRGEL